jgi:hypothetical protein
MANQNIPAGTTQNQPIQLNEFAQNLQVNGQLVADANQPAVRVSNTLNRVNVANSGLIRGDATAIQLEIMAQSTAKPMLLTLLTVIRLRLQSKTTVP